VTGEGQDDARMERTAFAVSPLHQGVGLGARALSEIEWLVSRFVRAGGSESSGIGGSSRLANVPAFEGACLPSTSSDQWSRLMGLILTI
jgi:hypothetical protein